VSTLRDEAMRSHPEFPWLEADDPAGVGRTLADLGWLKPGERVESAARAGEGNMNLTLRVITNERRFVLKQARPWVEKYPDIPAPWDRSEIEQRFYERAGAIDVVARRMPRIFGRSPEARLIVMEELPEARDMTSIYADDRASDVEIEVLARFLAGLHESTAGEDDPRLANRAMRNLNHEHIYRVPLDPGNGLELDTHEPGLREAAARLCADQAFVAHATATGRDYLSDGNHLVHGDFFPGSWMRTRDGLRIIDPEFAHYGAAELDLANAIAHLALADSPEASSALLLDGYAEAAPSIRTDRARLARFAAIEVVRRLIGVAQLPIAPSRGWRSEMLERARRAMRTADHRVFFA